MSVVSLIDRAIQEPLSLHRILLRSVVFFIEKAQYHRYGQDGLFHDLVERLEWARVHRDEFLYSLTFFTFYVNFPEFRLMVERVEVLAYPGTTEVTLSFLLDAVSQVLEDVCMSAFDQSNIVSIAQRFREFLVCYALHRPATYLGFPGFNPKVYIDTSDNVKAFPQRLLPTYEETRLRAESLKRCVAKMERHPPESLQWRSIVDTIARQQVILQHMAVYPEGHRVKRRVVIQEELTAELFRRHGGGGGATAEIEDEELLAGGEGMWRV